MNYEQRNVNNQHRRFATTAVDISYQYAFFSNQHVHRRRLTTVRAWYNKGATDCSCHTTYTSCRHHKQFLLSKHPHARTKHPPTQSPTLSFQAKTSAAATIVVYFHFPGIKINSIQGSNSLCCCLFSHVYTIIAPSPRDAGHCLVDIAFGLEYIDHP